MSNILNYSGWTRLNEQLHSSFTKFPADRTVWIIAVHPINGVAVEKLQFSDKDEMYLDDVQGWDSFEDYVEYYINDRIDYYEQKLYTAVAVENEERLSIVEELMN